MATTTYNAFTPMSAPLVKNNNINIPIEGREINLLS